VCEGLFTVTHTSAAMAAHATCVCYSRRMLETFSVSLTNPLHSYAVFGLQSIHINTHHQTSIRLSSIKEEERHV
jgi:hypothetical protein